GRALGPPILVDRLEIGRERERERVGLFEQRTLFGFAAPRQQDVGFGPRLGELHIRVLFRRRRRRRPLGERNLRGGAYHDNGERRRKTLLHTLRSRKGRGRAHYSAVSASRPCAN